MVSTAAAANDETAHGRSGRWELAGLYDCLWCSVAGGLVARPQAARNRDRRRQKLSPAEKVWPLFFLPRYFISSPALSQLCPTRRSCAAPGYFCATGAEAPRCKDLTRR